MVVMLGNRMVDWKVGHLADYLAECLVECWAVQSAVMMVEWREIGRAEKKVELLVDNLVLMMVDMTAEN